MEQLDLQKRLLIALALSLLVFIGSSYFLTPPQSSQTLQEKNATPQEKAAPQSQTPVSAVTSGAVTNSPTAPLESGNILTAISSKKFTLLIDEFGRISQATLMEEKYKDENGKNLKLFDPSGIKPLEVRFADRVLNEEAFKVPYTSSSSKVDIQNTPATITLTQKLTNLTITKEITFYADGHYDLKIKTTNPAEYFFTPGQRPIADTSIYMVVKGALVKESDGVINTIEDGDAKGDEVFENARFVSSFDRYYASVLYSLESGKGLNVTVAKEGGDNPLAFVKGDQEVALHGYIGPKEYRALHALDPQMTDVIEYGWFTFLAKPFFAVIMWINEYVGNWGWAIILFTILVKLILFPLSYKGMISMQKLKDLAPKMKELKEKYGSDPQKMNAKMMELYKKHGANPMGGCLPMLLQIPVFFALYRVLLNADELQGATWILWIEDLSKMDPYYILPLLMGASMYLQQKITPNNFTDPMQEKIFKYFPVLMTIFFVTFPSGLVLYWLVNNILSIAQQYYINSAYEKHKIAAALEHSKS